MQPIDDRTTEVDTPKSIEEKLKIIGNGIMALGCLSLIVAVVGAVVGAWLMS